MDEEPELRPLPPPPRCRGIPLGDGNYTGCAYGYGDVAPFTGPRDCHVCDGSGFEGPIETLGSSAASAVHPTRLVDWFVTDVTGALDESSVEVDVHVVVVHGRELQGREQIKYLLAEFGIANDATDRAGVLRVEDDDHVVTILTINWHSSSA